MTPGAKLASRRILYTIQLESKAFGLGFQTTALPTNAGADERLAAMAVKLNGDIAATKPSRPRIRKAFRVSDGEGLNG
ncbi:hypothetical protein BLA29_003070 [Euroglyphus maynei]|uniref:Uncharacterized protein n=1 Tax=Euroglyphus maynei TaxID=6958 RepID=A0A1Y3BMN7_EURMA|nr:hypothetical protein BLA29_003070 [Euroglyphus maynei]